MNRSILKLGSTLALLAALCAVHAGAADGTASISGVVRDSEGTPQIGAMVELLSANAAVLATTFTDSHGKFLIREIDPGTYKLKAVGTSFLPALRENLKVRTDTVVNMTLTTLFEAVQWLPAQKRTGSEPEDDWIWTLRSSSNRPAAAHAGRWAAGCGDRLRQRFRSSDESATHLEQCGSFLW